VTTTSRTMRTIALLLAILATPAAAFAPVRSGAWVSTRSHTSPALSMADNLSEDEKRLNIANDDGDLKEQVTGDFKKIFVAGGSKGVGRELVSQLIASGCTVKCLVRSEESAADLKAEGAICTMGDAFSYKDVEEAMDDCDACVTTLGGATGPDGKRVDYKGNSNVIEAAGILGVKRLVLVTSVGCGDSKGALSDEAYSSLEAALVEKDKAEKMLVKFYSITTDWTIVRPGGLMTAPATGKAILTTDTTALGAINRADVASLVTKCINNKETIKKTLSAIDPSIETAFGNGNFGEAQKFDV